MSQASYAAMPHTLGQVSHNNAKVVKVHPALVNDATHIAVNPDAGRVTMQLPDGTQYTTVSAVTTTVGSTTVTMLHEGV